MNAAATVRALYVDPAKNPDFTKVCSELVTPQHRTAIPYAAATNNGWAAYNIPSSNEGEVISTICGRTFTITVNLNKFPGATDQNALDLAMAMVNH